MKTTMTLKPLVFALAAIMAIAAQAENKKDDYQPKPDPILTALLSAGAGASVVDVQNTTKNYILNQGTENNAKLNSSVNGNSGNVGVNNAAGDGNQQDNSAAIATADEHFIFGSAAASTNVTQTNTTNSVANYSTKNAAELNSSANRNSGNLGLNNAAGDFNQQKNNLAIAVSGGRVATAVNLTNQQSTGLVVTNNADRKYEEKKPNNGSWFESAGDSTLQGSYTQQELKYDGWKNVVTNNATLNSSVNGNSGNIGINNAAGVGNQQSNSLSIAAGCKACASTGL